MTHAFQILHGQPRDIGFPVRRLLPQIQARAVGPFVFLDHMGPARFRPGTRENDVRAHPHIGLGTITYLFSGAMMHRDSLGVVQRIQPGALNWMCAGRGVVHSERIPADIRDAGIDVEGIQMWIALPAGSEELAPAFEHHAAETLPLWQADGASWRLLIGQWGAHRSPLRVPPETFYAAGELAPDARFQFPPEVAERALYVASGELRLEALVAQAGDLVVLPPEAAPVIEAQTASRVMLLGGAPLDAPRHMWWNFVSTSRERIAQAAADWEAGRFPSVPGEDESIPAPPLNRS
ncbi:MAG: pirin family protein [Candidatus Dactylopiibacterium sp.]|nr:pirin family protein [Candidatus Dactylopiibacterium sp.]